jgi:hemerythrin
MKQLFVEWSDDLSVGIQEIDEQHKILVNLINRLFDETALNEADPRVIEEIMSELIEYTVVHFAVEESLFRIFDYPEIETHIGHHHDLKVQVFEIQEKIKVDPSIVNTELLIFLKNWLEHHIQQEDKLYASFLIEHGVKSSWAKTTWLGKIWKSHK